MRNIERQRQIESFAAHHIKCSKKFIPSLSNFTVNCIERSRSVSLNEVKKLRKERKY